MRLYVTESAIRFPVQGDKAQQRTAYRIVGVGLCVAVLTFLVSGCSNVVRRTSLVGDHTETLERVEPQSSLSRFIFEFENGDHRINRIRLTRNTDGSILNVAFADDSPDDDQWRYAANFVPIDGIPVRSLAGNITAGADLITIPGLGSGSRFALAGFSLQLARDGVAIEDFDQKIRSITIWPNENEGTVLVGFKDTDGSEFVYNLQYQLVPAFRVLGTPIEDPPEGATRDFENLSGDRERRVLSGFSFFLRGLNDIHLLKLGVCLRTGRVEFQDNDIAEPIDWKVKYLILRD